MHGPEHWFGLVRAWIIVGVLIYCFWTLLELVHRGARRMGLAP
ncbi:hypothetical protein [Natronomonas marina]|jgi:hypothetical protein|nr:hypothetical protein [Natronomonas marina]